MNLKKIQNPFGGLIYYKESTTSTMSEARDLLSEESHGSICITDFQSNGIGRIPGRTWHSESKDNLMFTLILEKNIFY